MMRNWMLVFAIGCGGGGKVAQEPKQPTECQVIGNHVAEIVATFKEPLPADKDLVADVVRTHCDGDGWSAGAKKCFASMFDEAGAKECIGQLSADQHTKMLTDLEKRSGHAMHADPPPPPPPPPPTKSNDPCEGGE